MPDRESRRRVDRREFVGLGVGIFVVAALPVAIRRRSVVARRSLPLMGTLADLTVVHRDERTAQVALDAAFAELQWVEQTMTRFTASSDVGRVNAGAHRDGVRVSTETGVVLERGLRWAEASDGRFDPAMGAVVELWDVANRHQPPTGQAQQALAARRFWQAVDLATGGQGAVVRFTDPSVRLDLGGIAKGYAVDRAVEVLRGLGVDHAIVNVGGDLYALGERPEGGAWQVGIRSPHDDEGLATTLVVSDQAVCTSGDYAQYFRWGGTRYHHLMDPESAAPRRDPYHSLTVQADRCIDADAGATAAFGLDHLAAARLIRPLAPSATVLPLA